MPVEREAKALLTCRQFIEAYPWPSESALRAIIQDAEIRGFATAFKRFGRRVLIDPQEFFSCLDRQQTSSKQMRTDSQKEQNTLT